MNIYLKDNKIIAHLNINGTSLVFLSSIEDLKTFLIN